MKVVPTLFRITSIVIFIQLLLGGLVTFNFIGPDFHIITGILVFVLAVATLIVTLRMTTFKPLRGISIGLVALIVVQMILGVEALQTSNAVFSWIHFGVAMGIYAMSVAGSIMASISESMAAHRQIPQNVQSVANN
jgi:heme A synthase